MMLRQTLDFLLYEWMDVQSLSQRERFSEHSRATYDAVLDTCERIAREKLAPANRTADVEEPSFDGEQVRLPKSTVEAVKAQVGSGILGAAQDYEVGGMQLPCSVQMACNALFAQASVAINAYSGLTRANAGLLLTHGTDAQKQAFAYNELAGRWLGTMCLSEPQAGSSLGGIVTQATPDGNDYALDPLGPRYRIKGNKMWISAGDHEITENIIHLVLAKIPGPDGKLPYGVKGISLFVVPKMMVGPDGKLTGERNDVALAGLNHKLGYRGTTNTLLNFGEGKFSPRGQGGAIGYLVGEPGEGLRCMFHMMNEARINVGVGAIMLGHAGYEASLEYASQRRQGQLIGSRSNDPTLSQVRIIEHPDVRRMLLAQKSYVEGGLALAIYCARLVDEQRTGTSKNAAEAGVLLEMLTPIIKSWPSEFCLEANSLAIQVHGGYGYTRDFPVEQYWRDNRLNMIHEGTHGIQGIDLLGRKVRMNDGAGLALLSKRIEACISKAGGAPNFPALAAALQRSLKNLCRSTDEAWSDGDAAEAITNATPYLQAFGHTVIAWMWLEVGLCAALLLERQGDSATLRGKLAAMRYFFVYELPKVDAWLAPVSSRESVFRELDEACY